MLNRREFLQAAALGGTAIGLVGCGFAAGNDAATPAQDADAAATTEPVAVRTAALKGPTAMGLVRFMSEADAGNLADEDWSFQILASADEVTPLIAKSEVDVAAVPANLASVLYNKTVGGVRVVAVNTLGVLYVCELGDEVNTVSDLRGRTIYSAGKGATPQYALEYVLRQAGLDPGSDVTIEWKSEHAECVAALAEGAGAVAMLPQPFVTTAQAKNDQIRVALDLNREWESACEAAGQKARLITGVAVVRSEFADAHPEAVDAFLDHYRESVEYVNGNVEEAAKLVAGYGIVPETVAAKALPACNITFVAGQDMRDQLSGYLQILAGQNAQAVGGALPGDDFYFGV
ncbi:ABC transporter substrate-binding protein [Paratractidigestivibacter faecalis]|uniref:ABC transporter substrate-binding protein n=1 Tax=Paratractidigestivibacter faecalis TaxID=2292441 RepID=UPI003AB4DCBB